MSDPVAVTLPSMGESVSEGTVSRWLKAVGDAVTEGEPLVEVTTDKVDVELPAPVTGRLTEILAEEGATIDVGGTLGRIDAGAPSGAVSNGSSSQADGSGAAIESPAPTGPARSEKAAAGGEGLGAAEHEGVHPAGNPDNPSTAAPRGTGPDVLAPGPAAASPAAPAAGSAPPASPAESLRISPLARRAAAIAGVDPSPLRGSGPGGAVRTADVAGNRAAGNGAAGNGAVGNGAVGHAIPPPARATPGPLDDEVTPLRGPAAALVQYMEQSRELPTATSFRTVEVGVLDARRRQLNAALKQAGREEKVSFTHLIGYAVALAAHQRPAMASHFARDSANKPVRVQAGIHLGLAVDLQRQDGSRFLVVPVIRDAAGRDFDGFRAEYERLVAAARSGTLGADELKGAALTLTNPGGIGTVASVPRLMPGQGTIVALGAIDYPPGLRGGGTDALLRLGVSKVMTITSTYDHRVIQGAMSGEFLGVVEQLLGGADGFWQGVFSSLGVQLPPDTAAASPAPPAHATPLRGGEARFSEHELYAVAAAMSLVKAHRTHGYLGAHLDPLGTEPTGDPAMEPATVHLSDEDMQAVSAEYLRVYVPGATLAEVLPRLRETYCGTIAYEIEHISSHEQRVWLREHIESGRHRQPLSPERKVQLLHRLSKVDAMERYLRRTFVGQKTYSIEGLEAMVPMTEELLGMVTEHNIGQVVIGMAHRGRLAMICHVVNRPYESVLSAFERGELRSLLGSTGDVTGDVKYHIGATGTYLTDHDKAITVRLLPNPSHLEAVDPVVEGWTRAEQTRRGASTLHVDPTAALPLLIHGDASFSGQGIIAEVLNLQSLAGYSTGGTVHIIANNQVGFTTDPTDGRSTRNASDLAKGYDVPIVHVNADDIEACIAAIRLAYSYRAEYHRDVVIDLIGYRRSGHNEADEPAYTQPVMYQRIKAHPTVRELFVERLVGEGLITKDAAAQLSDQYYQRIGEAHARVKSSLSAGLPEEPSVEPHAEERLRTAVAPSSLVALNEQLLTVPPGFNVHPKLTKQFERRRQSLTGGLIEWATAEALAFASLLVQGRAIRLTGQDTERGTFSQRHLVLHDSKTGGTWTPMLHLVRSSATFELHNSPLSEVACLGFEYGYSAAAPDTMVLWEAQFGDFVNNAQLIIDQFISSGAAKWEQQARLTLLLPHGYEGAGPEHSSARLERFLSLAASGNMRVANPSTAAQYFHLLRSQALSSRARPLVVMTPKSLLRLKEAGSTLEELSTGTFQRVIDDPAMASSREQVQTLLLCTGKIYHDLISHPLRRQVDDLAIARVELLHPLPLEEILEVIRGYPRLEQLFWVQEEPSNMGAWPNLSRPLGRRRPYELRWDYIGRPRRSSPSEGYNGSHQVEQERIISTALSMSRSAQERAAAPDQPSA